MLYALRFGGDESRFINRAENMKTNKTEKETTWLNRKTDFLVEYIAFIVTSSF